MHRLEGGNAGLGSKPGFLTFQLHGPGQVTLPLFPHPNMKVELALEQRQV